MEKTMKNKQITSVKHIYLTKRTKVRIGAPIIFLFISLITLLSMTTPPLKPKTIIWKLDNPTIVGGLKPAILGSPAIVQDKMGTALSFNGVDDGLILPVNPIENWSQFTIEVLFKPTSDGPPAPRFVHFQDSLENRGTLEIRVTPKGRWYADTFLRNGKAKKGLTLIDSTMQHPCDQWYWLALVFDGKKMSDYVNAVKEHEGEVEFSPMNAGQISLGVRLNKVSWFKGQIREIRFHPTPLNSQSLQHVSKSNQ